MESKTPERRVPARLAVQILAGRAVDQILWGILVGGLYIARTDTGLANRCAIALLVLVVANEVARRRQAASLLRGGALVEARVGQMHTMRNRPRIFYDYDTPAGRLFSVEAGDVDGPLIVSQPLVYDQQKPEEAFLVRELPGSPTLDSSGTWRSTGRWWLGLILPALAILGNAACWVLGL